MQEHPVQTNEVQRSWVLLPLFLHALGSSEAHVVELGASAGLNLVWDRYRYRYGAGAWGREDALLSLAGDERRPVPGRLLAATPRVRSRIGIDLAPVDVTGEEGARLLRSFVWADQEDRLARLDRAIEAVRAEPPQIVRGDAAEALPGVLGRLPAGGLVLVFQTAVFNVLTAEARARVRAALDSAGREVVFVSAGRPRGLRRVWGMRVYRGGERFFAGHADYHGAWLDYEWSPARAGS